MDLLTGYGRCERWGGGAGPSCCRPAPGAAAALPSHLADCRGRVQRAAARLGAARQKPAVGSAACLRSRPADTLRRSTCFWRTLCRAPTPRHFCPLAHRRRRRLPACSGDEPASSGEGQQPKLLSLKGVSAAPAVETAGMQLVAGQAVPMSEALHLQGARVYGGWRACWMASALLLLGGLPSGAAEPAPDPCLGP